MKSEQISVKTQGKPEIEFSYDFSETLPEAVKTYGEDDVHELFKRALTIAAQANARKMLAAGLTPERIQIEMSNWKPGVSVRLTSSIKTVDPMKVISENFDDWTPERQEEILRLIQERFAKRGEPAAAAPVENGTPEPTAEEIAAITEGVNGDTQESTTQTVEAAASTETPAHDYNPAEGRGRRNR